MVPTPPPMMHALAAPWGSSDECFACTSNLEFPSSRAWAITRQTLESSVPLCVAMSTGDEHGLGVTMYVLMMRYTPSQV